MGPTLKLLLTYLKPTPGPRTGRRKYVIKLVRCVKFIGVSIPHCFTLNSSTYNLTHSNLVKSSQVKIAMALFRLEKIEHVVPNKIGVVFEMLVPPAMGQTCNNSPLSANAMSNLRCNYSCAPLTTEGKKALSILKKSRSLPVQSTPVLNTHCNISFGESSSFPTKPHHTAHRSP